jgi:hypothetical protein
MKSAVLLCLSAFAVAAAAQQPAQRQQEQLEAQAQKALDLEHTVNRCPIAMDARQEGGLHMVRTQDGSKAPQQPAITPSLILTAPQGRQILSATITAHGYAAPKSAMPLEVQGQAVLRSQPTGRTELTSTVTVKFESDGAGSFSGKFRLPGFTVLESVDLNSVTFGDGSTWSFTSASGCHVTPDPFVLVSASLASPR